MEKAVEFTLPAPVLPILAEKMEENVIEPKWRIVLKLVKIIVFVFCISGFGYQVMAFSSHFLTFPTVVNIEVETPDTFVVPALTFCNLNPVQRSFYCEKYPDRCKSMRDMATFCNQYPQYCKGDLSNFKVPKSKFQADSLKPPNKLTEIDIIELGQNSSYLDVTDTYAKNSKFLGNHSRELSRIFFGSAEKVLHSCYVFNARFTGKLEMLSRKFEDDVTTPITFHILNVQPEESFRTFDKPGIKFSVHSPLTSVNPYIKGMAMYPGTSYKIHLRLEMERLLPYPHKTDCFDYEESWGKSGKKAPRSQQMCRRNCNITFNNECYGCQKYLPVFLEGDDICPVDVNMTCEGDKLKEVREYLRSCLKQCKKDCTRHKYPFRVEEITETHLEETNLIVVTLSVDDPEVLVLSHNPQYQNVEIFSYVGGFMGCWLGLSIWACYLFIAEKTQSLMTNVSKRVHQRKAVATV